mmetsp:Transcript_8735/g.12125  ORF Transcript_8735/g.12125 Transcript_8735/m.12125 type:complete len:83 (+) Transcript_8735:1222-1470(+)
MGDKLLRLILKGGDSGGPRNCGDKDLPMDCIACRAVGEPSGDLLGVLDRALTGGIDPPAEGVVARAPPDLKSSLDDRSASPS